MTRIIGFGDGEGGGQSSASDGNARSEGGMLCVKKERRGEREREREREEKKEREERKRRENKTSESGGQPAPFSFEFPGEARPLSPT